MTGRWLSPNYRHHWLCPKLITQVLKEICSYVSTVKTGKYENSEERK
jgi:hypothetical protein